jgi:hypothetical protein
VLLGLSEDAVRSRLKRGMLSKEKAKDGTVLVVLETGDSPDRPTNSTARPNDQSTTGQPPDQSDLVEVLCDQVGFLHQQLEEEREANRENQRLIRRASAAGARARACTGAARRARDGLGGAGQGCMSPSGQQKPSERRSWWRQFFRLE